MKEAADSLRPPGPDVAGRKMGEDNYINRLVDWITNQEQSETMRDLIVAELEHLGQRLDAVDDAGHKGAHADVSRLEASRFLVSTYMLLGDILRFAPASPDDEPVSGVAEPPLPLAEQSSTAPPTAPDPSALVDQASPQQPATPDKTSPGNG